MRTIKCQMCGKEVEAKSNVQKYCSECAKEHSKEYGKKYREDNKKKIAAQRKEWRENNKERVRAKNKEYYENNKEKCLAKQKERYENNKEKINAQHKEYRENNKEKVAAGKKKYYEKNKEKISEKKRNKYTYADIEGNNFCVYIHTDPIGKVYVGRSVGEDVETVNAQRWQNGHGYKTQKFYDECIAVYGWENIQHEIIEWNLTYEEAIEQEEYWIARYNSRNPEYGYNVA